MRHHMVGPHRVAALALSLAVIVMSLFETDTSAMAQEPEQSEQPEQCPLGQTRSVDTAGNCCWPGQAWSGERCVGEPTSCPDGFDYSEDRTACVLLDCEEGRVRTADQIHCCWPDQGYSSAAGACVGTPSCPQFYLPEGKSCVPGPRLTDADSDGIVDAEDRCMDTPEDFDGFEDEDGCRDPDNDDDDILDADDACPDQKEDEDGYQDDDGCPEEDNDSDGIVDADDACPDRPEDMDYFEDEDGCPDDNDRDGVADADDRCPDQLEDDDGFEDYDGCPDLDNDDDGLADAVDKCPQDAEDYDLFEDEDGCSDRDNDGDTVADTGDLCPHEIEDKEGKYPGDGCEMPPWERYAIGWFGQAGQKKTTFRVTSRRFLTQRPANDRYNMLMLGWDITFGWFDLAIDLPGIALRRAGAAPDPNDERFLLAHLFGVSTGVNVLSWPQRDRNWFSLVNISVGVSGWSYINTTGGLPNALGAAWIRQQINLGDFVVQARYEHTLAETLEDATVAPSLTFGIGFDY